LFDRFEFANNAADLRLVSLVTVCKSIGWRGGRPKRIEASIYNYERLTTLLHNAERKLEKRGVKITRVVPPKIALPLLEHATMEHEDDLHELWENLLVSALGPSEEEVKHRYVSVLSELTEKDARALRRL
jgi:hypothetical protein